VRKSTTYKLEKSKGPIGERREKIHWGAKTAGVRTEACETKRSLGNRKVPGLPSRKRLGSKLAFQWQTRGRCQLCSRCQPDSLKVSKVGAGTSLDEGMPPLKRGCWGVGGGGVKSTGGRGTFTKHVQETGRREHGWRTKHGRNS